MLNLVASTEATIKVDFFRRVGNKRKDPLSKSFLGWFKTLTGRKQLRPDFDEILSNLKQAGVMNNRVIGQFRECLRVRHWVGHGRYWAKPAAVDRLDPEDVYARADALIKALPQ